MLSQRGQLIGIMPRLSPTPGEGGKEELMLLLMLWWLLVGNG